MELATLGLMDDADIDLVEAGIALSLADRPRADPQRLRRLVSGWAIILQRDLAPATGKGRALRLAGLIAGDAGLTGDMTDYDNPLNADLIAVAERGRGLPIALSILYIALARRVGWRVDALALPGHVLLEVHGGGESTLLDPFDHGTTVSPARAAEIARHGGGTAIAGRFPVMSNRQMLVRMVSNQASRALLGGDSGRALTLYERLTVLAPRVSALWWERARLEQRIGRLAAARASLTAMLETTHDPALVQRIRTTLATLAQSDN
ncbi:transglutaminase family protein [Sandarakinorhabdus oryzae]|uniref:transglutaminase family protein n=1 Tax=Sandarakinorhabdus oryzae TaxID=2675220 RepID=UPI0018CBF383|nr:transglutaminase-like domain-containing protein [Sandarakinorhabdus oryzae]